MSAWTRSANGTGVKIGVVDSGIDTDSPEFAGRIDPASRDVAGNASVEDEDGHGTNVAMIAAAARNNTGIVGIAYNATIIAMRADRPGTCATTGEDEGCRFLDRDIALGVDRAVAAGATVVNLSLGGENAPGAQLLDSIRRAAAAGVVIVVSAGNEGDGTDTAYDPNNPTPFAAAVRAAAGSAAIIAGSVNENGQISAFSNRAGNHANWYLSALGERICCVYENGVLKTETRADGTYVQLFSGTSFSAPQISGAVALLKQAFPNLSAAQMVDILLSSARDAGNAGTDSTYGRGILDIAAAFAPRGTTTVAGGTTSVQLGDDEGVGSGPMGDSLDSVRLSSIVLDDYGRAYNYDMSRGLRRASVAPRLQNAIDSSSRVVGGGSQAVSMAFTLADGTSGKSEWIAPLRLTQADAEAARVLAGRVALKLAPGKTLGVAFNERADGLVAQLQGYDRPAFLIASDARGEAAFAQAGDVSAAYRTEVGKWGLTASAERGKAWFGNTRVEDGRRERARETRGLQSFSLAADRQFGNLDAAFGITWLNEDSTVLGAYFANALGGAGANSLFLDANAGWRFADDWRLGGAVRQGWTVANGTSAISAGPGITSRAWSADVTKSGVFGSSDSLGFRVSQPLRVEGGGIGVTLPTGYDYATLLPTYGTSILALTPQGREIDSELAWRGSLFGGEAAASLFYRTEPGHVAAMPDDKGVALKWSKRF